MPNYWNADHLCQLIEEKQGNSKKNWLVKKENSDQKTEHDDLIELGTGQTVQEVVGYEYDDDEVPPPRTELVDCNIYSAQL